MSSFTSSERPKTHCGINKCNQHNAAALTRFAISWVRNNSSFLKVPQNKLTNVYNDLLVFLNRRLNQHIYCNRLSACSGSPALPLSLPKPPWKQSDRGVRSIIMAERLRSGLSQCKENQLTCYQANLVGSKRKLRTVLPFRGAERNDPLMQSYSVKDSGMMAISTATLI